MIHDVFLFSAFSATASVLAYSAYCLSTPKLHHRLRNLYRLTLTGQFVTVGCLIFYLYRDKYLPEKAREAAATAALVEARTQQETKK